MAERKLTREEKKVLYRRLILDAAKNEFIRKGYKEASIAAIMDEAKLGVGTFYNYFASKEEILLCLLAKLMREVAQRLAQMKKAGEPAGNRLKEGCHLTARLLGENQYVLALFLSVGRGEKPDAHPNGRAAAHPEAAAANAKASRAPQVKDLFLQIIEEGQAEGSIRTDIAAPMIAEMLHATYQSAAFSHTGLPFRKNFEQKFQLLIEGMKA